MSLPVYYRLSPIWVQNLLINLKGLAIKRSRFGKEFYKKLLYFEASNPNVVNRRNLKTFLLEANRTSYWNKKFKEFNVNLDSYDIELELAKLPIMNKHDVLSNIDDIKNRPINERIISINTSGTTGSGLVFQQTTTMETSQWAIWWRYRRRLGIGLNDWMGWFGGRSIVPIDQKKPPFWRVNRPMKQIMFSAHHLNIHSVEYYYNIIRIKRIQWLHGYPSQLSYFAELIKEKGLEPMSSIRFITTGAENLLEHQKRVIFEVLGCRPFQHYGLAEGVANISELPNGDLQIDSDFAYLELVPSEISKGVYKLIGTNYSNTAFPLIRYDTNDLVEAHEDEGVMKITAINGRNEDFITLPNGVKLGRLDHIFKEAVYVKEAQICQLELNKIVLKIVKSEIYNNVIHEPKILKECYERFGTDIQISIEYFDELPRTQSGKLKFVISNIK